MKLSHTSSCLGATQQWHLRGSAPRPTRHCRSARTLAAPPAAGAEGGLFGGLKQAFSNPGKQQQQQQQQQQQAPQQQPTPQQQQPPGRAAGTVAAPEFPPYQVFKKGAVYDLRFYSPYPVVEMDYERREMAYLALGEYQSGANASSTKFGFTQPVVMQYHTDGRKVMQMMVGSRRDQQQQREGSSADITSLPAPSDSAVRLSVAGGELVAVLPFEGYITPEAAAAARQRLLRALEADGLKLAEAEAGGMFRVAQYGAVYTLEARVNEMMLAVAV